MMIKGELDLDEFRPIHLENIQEFKQLLGKYVVVENSYEIWSSNRKDLNPDGKILITKGIVQFLEYLRDNFINRKFQWDGLLLHGLSGSGKSVAFALSASYLSSFEFYDVYWFRTGELYKQNIADLLETPINKKNGLIRIIFVDQADKLDRRLDTFIGSGNENIGIFTVGCASGNARVRPSSSRATRIKEHLYNPSIDYSLFKFFFNLSDNSQSA
jgi:hypothetical protein